MLFVDDVVVLVNENTDGVKAKFEQFEANVRILRA